MQFMRNAHIADRMTIWLGICFTMLVLLPPIGLIMLGLFFPIYLVVMLYVLAYEVIRNAFSN